MDKSMTAAELMARLNADPEYVAMRQRREAELAARQEELSQAEAPLAEALQAIGLQVGSAWDMVNTAEPYPEALATLLAHLKRAYPDAVREGIARALAVSDAGFAWDELLELFKQERSRRVKDGIAVALSVIARADERHLDEVVALIREPAHGPSRGILLSVFRKPVRNAREVLTGLLDDPDLKKEARFLLRRYRDE